MPYTLMKGWAWVLLGVLLGIFIGWLLRSIAAKRQINRARKQNVDAAEVVRLRGRVADLEEARAERDLLKAELDNYRARGAPNITELQGIASAPPTLRVSPAPEADAGAPGLRVSSDEPDAGAPSLRVSPAPEPDAGAPGLPSSDETGSAVLSSAASPSGESERAVQPGPVSPSTEPGAGVPTLPFRPGAAPIFPEPPPKPDVAGSREVFGTAIQLDDLKVVEGIGPKIESLCHGIGIHTWFDLSLTEVSLLRTMLTDAGPRFRTHNPSTWPDQAALLAAGRWADFKTLTDGLRGGRAVN